MVAEREEQSSGGKGVSDSLYIKRFVKLCPVNEKSEYDNQNQSSNFQQREEL